MALAAMAAQRRRLAGMGRGGDTMVGHLTPGEVVLPADVLAQPGVRAGVGRAFWQAGVPMGRYTVGGRDDSRNPRTGMREYAIGDPGGIGGGGSAGPGGDGDRDRSRQDAAREARDREARDAARGGRSTPGTPVGKRGGVGSPRAPDSAPLGDPRSGPDIEAAKRGWRETKTYQEMQYDREVRAQDRELAAEEAARQREKTGNIIDIALGVGWGLISKVMGFDPVTAAIQGVTGYMTSREHEVGKTLAAVADEQGINLGQRGPTTPSPTPGTRTPGSRTPGAGPEGGDPPARTAAPAAATTKGSKAAAQEGEGPLAALGVEDESVFWRPQPLAPDVTWLAHTNAKIEQARRATRQRVPRADAPVRSPRPHRGVSIPGVTPLPRPQWGAA